jgi:hypothetical protein
VNDSLRRRRRRLFVVGFSEFLDVGEPTRRSFAFEISNLRPFLFIYLFNIFYKKNLKFFKVIFSQL